MQPQYPTPTTRTFQHDLATNITPITTTILQRQHPRPRPKTKTITLGMREHISDLLQSYYHNFPHSKVPTPEVRVEVLSKRYPGRNTKTNSWLRWRVIRTTSSRWRTDIVMDYRHGSMGLLHRYKLDFPQNTVRNLVPQRSYSNDLRLYS